MPGKKVENALEGASKAAAKRAARKGKARQENAVNSELNDETTPWLWRSIADPTISKQPVVFTPDYRFFFLAVSTSVKIYSVLTGSVISTLSSPSSQDSHSNTITSMMINPQNPFQLYTVSLDGTFKVWDFIEGILLQTIQIGHPITHICAHASIDGFIFVACSKVSKKKKEQAEGRDQSLIFRISLKTTAATSRSKIQQSTEAITVGKIYAAIGMGISASGKWLVVAGGSKAYVSSTSDLKTGFTKFVSPEKLTSFSLHPTEDWFATGDAIGQIRLWYCLQDDISFEKLGVEKRAQTTTLHWHAHAVQAVSFTPNGAYLLSGGEESVLVLWQLHSGKREFVPRVGAPIHTISVCDASDMNRDQEYILSLADGTLTFVRASSLKISRSISQVKLEPAHLQIGPRPPLAYHQQTHNLLLPSSHPSSLQVYSTVSSMIISELEVAPSNRVSRRDEKQLVPTQVEAISITGSGRWLATADARDDSDDGFGIDAYLKVWEWSSSDKTWSLNTKIHRPHRANRVNSLEFSSEGESGDPLLLTAGGDLNIKTWGLKRSSQVQPESWVNRSTFSYRSQPPLQATFSPDASIMAVCHSQAVTVWSVRTNVMQIALTCADLHDASRVAFVGSTGRYLCASSIKEMTVWDLLSTQVIYSFRSPAPITSLITSIHHDNFLICRESSSHPQSTVFSVFSPSSSECLQHRTVPFRIRQCIVTKHPKEFSLLGIAHDGKLVEFGDILSSRTEEASSSASPLSSKDSKKHPTLFQDIFGKSALLDQGSLALKEANHPVSNLTQIDLDLFSGPSHLLPSMQSLFMPFVEGMLRSNKQTQDISPIPEEIEEEGDVEMADQEEASPFVREVDETELISLVELFKSDTFKPSPIVASKPVQNGKMASQPTRTVSFPVVNGKNHQKSDSQSRVSKSKRPDVILPPRQLSSSPEPVQTGRKRKKSSFA